ncbi:hypothetical protein [Flavobacterium mekongense]|uniref:hypothetical protein n=1 Tax=Flavobacterium mekongense TaxID=3379707 RepID=UPI00399ACC33
MSATPQNTDNQEIDLSQISKKIGEFFEGISDRIFRVILFFKRNIIWVGILFVTGAGLGFYLDKTSKVYVHQIIVTPNFGSTDYLYAKVDLINSKINNGDTLFLKEVIGIETPKKVKAIKIEPIIDAYKFIDNKPQNFELIKLMAEDGDLEKILKDELTSKNYPYHSVSFVTDGETTIDKSVTPLLNYLNNSEFYKNLQKEYLNNVKEKMVKNDSIINQINTFLNTFSSSINSSSKSDKLVYYNENSQLNEVIKTKDALTSEQGNHRLELVSMDRIIKDISTTINVKSKSLINGKLKFLLPLFFIMLFIAARVFRSFYRYNMLKINN